MWGYCLLLLMVLWILFDGFEAYRDHLERKIKEQFKGMGEIRKGEAKGPLLSKTRLIFVIDASGIVLDSCQIYSCRLIPFPMRKSANQIKGRIASVEDASEYDQQTLVQKAFFNAVEDHKYQTQLEMLVNTNWRIESVSEADIEWGSRIYDNCEIEKIMKDMVNEGIKIEFLNKQEKLLLRYLLLKIDKSHISKEQEEEEQHEC